MSGIAVEWRENDEVDPELVGCMLRQMPHRARDGSGVVTRPQVAIGLASTSHVPEHMGSGPLTNDRGDVLAFDGRLDRRGELASALGLSQELGDASLVLGALERWGASALERIFGDFAFAFVDATSGDLLLARDRLGQRPLYYAKTPRGWRAASEAQAMFVDDQLVARPNLDELALALVREHAGRHATLLDGIDSLPPGETLTLSRTAARRTSYWSLERCARLPHLRAGEAVDALEEVLGRAVEDRLRARGPVAIAVSGGLDSSVVAAMAARRASAAPVLVTSRYPGLACDEASFSNRLAGHLELPISAFHLPAGADEFAPLAHRDLLSCPADTVMRGMAHLAANAGSTVVLMGSGSDELQWRTGFEADEALHEGRVGLAAEFAQIYDEPFGLGNWQRFARATVRRTLGRPLHERLRRAPWGEATWEPSHASSSARARIARMRSERLAREVARGVVGRAQEMLVSGLIEGEQVPFGVGQRALLGSFLGYELREPFLDQRVVELLVGLSVLVRTEPGRSKPLLRDLGARWLPPALAHRRTPSTEFSSFSRHATLADPSGLRDLFARSRLENLGLLVPGAATAMVDQALAGAPDTSELANLKRLEHWASAWEFGR